ncbi:iron-siderophore ABC transporter substrate-binding protein [Rhodococcus triatomae]|uniref:Iron complex transport system substrate-binding protein n=1 Tax=Rhodococcus triatomae TaxID=300028 RepID=A0A1G8MMR5_9NOCA|nr:iron-siderophore ABC transporter substrate-binding protein [Rhodococcus triatomae]QNG19038.1 iron-siderophore ABC transporter substrate-binding protein [Rhodococcus triatomae]QNG25049.1 iron-siderophore ABC transporter substrate-binding protein [Rhodococcus triatomae]SDI69222.1 iron complex transport system substrate-binding protein [Rhodococcus triatomae]
MFSNHLRPLARRRLAAVAVAGAATLVLASCSSGDDDTTSAEAGDGFPVTIANTFGETTIDSKPERIVTLGWNAQDIVYALGETPVGMPRYDYGADPNGVMPWLQDQFDPDATTLLDAATSIPVEAVAGLAPDVILAPYEGFEEGVYDQLSTLAPTVAYPDKAWQTTWQDQTTLVGEALGRSDDAAGLVEELDRTLADTAAAHPEYQGKTISVISLDEASSAAVYMPTDPRVQLLTEIGFEVSPGVQALADSDTAGAFYRDISLENLGDVDADVVIVFLPEDRPLAEYPVLGALGATARGGVLGLADQRIVAGLSQTSVLATPWVLDQLTPQLTAVAES